MAKNVNKEVKIENTDIMVAGVKCVEIIGTYKQGNKTEVVPMEYIVNGKVQTEVQGLNTNLTHKGNIQADYNKATQDEVNFVNSAIHEIKGSKVKIIFMSYYKWEEKENRNGVKEFKNNKYGNESCFMCTLNDDGTVKRWLLANVNGGAIILTIRALFGDLYNGEKGHNKVNSKYYLPITGRNDAVKKNKAVNPLTLCADEMLDLLK